MPKKYQKDLDLENARYERQRARETGQVVFTGKACGRCGSRDRYTSNGACIFCVTGRDPMKAGMRRAAREERDEAEMKGKVTYINPNPCKRCGGLERYVINSGCVACMKARVLRVRETRAALHHSDTSPIVWVNREPSPETAAYYAMCPALAAYGGKWTAVYSDAQHLSPGFRLYPGCDVFRRPAALQAMLNDKKHPGHEIAQHLAPGYYAALSAFNLKVRGITK